jgi:chaperone required for assembly of F1-ATPase
MAVNTAVVAHKPPYISAMRDFIEDLISRQPLDPSEAARRNMQTRRRRFYATAEVRPDPKGFAIMLDGRPIRTPARRFLATPGDALAIAIADEWRRQGEFIDPADMPLTRLANTIIDGVTAAPDTVAAEVSKYLGCDLVCYRAATPAALAARQSRHWNPVVAWAREALGARFDVNVGLMPFAQPAEALAAARTAIPREPWRLGAVHAVTTLTGSALIALMIEKGALTRDVAWAAAHVDEDWNAELWGRDELAERHRAFRFAEMAAAAAVLDQPVEAALS